jgi:hypothetical protein
MKKIVIIGLTVVLIACDGAAKTKTVYLDSKTGQAVAPPAPAIKDYSAYYDKVCLGGTLYWKSKAGHYNALTPVVELRGIDNTFHGVTC